MQRYARHAHLLTEEQFARVRKARVLVAGAGGLGCTVLQLLTRYGFGEIHLYDDACVDPPDLNRQLLYTTQDLGSLKVSTAQQLLHVINPDVTLTAHRERLTEDTNVPDVDIVLDCLDNFTGRVLLDDFFFKCGIPIVHGGVSDFFGQVTTLLPGKTPALAGIYGRCNMQDDIDIPKNIYPPVVTAVASLQTSEAVKLAAGLHEQLLLNRIQTIDLLTNSFDIIKIR